MTAGGTAVCDGIDALLPSFYDGDLEAADRQRVAAHLDGCPGCRAALVNLGSAMAALHGLPMPDVGDLPDRVRRAAADLARLPVANPSWRWRTTAVAAIAASIILASAAFLGHWSGRRSVPTVGQQLGADGLVATSDGWLTPSEVRERASGRVWLDGRWTDPGTGAARILAAQGMQPRDDLWLGRASAERLDAGQVLRADGWIAPDRLVAERLQQQGLTRTGDSWIAARDVAGLRRDGVPVEPDRVVSEQLAGQGYVREASGTWRLASEAERLADEAARLARGEGRRGPEGTPPEASAAARRAAAGFRRDSDGGWHAPEPPAPAAAPERLAATALPAGWRALAGVPAVIRTAERAGAPARALAAIHPGGGGSPGALSIQPRQLAIARESGLAGGWIVHLPGAVSGTPAVLAGRVHVSAGDKRVLAVHAATGKGLWSSVLSDDTPSNPVGCDDEDVAYTTGSCTLYTLAGANGRVVMNAWISGSLSAMPASGAGLLMATSPEGGSWTAMAVDPRSGRRVWAASLPAEVRTGLLTAGGRTICATQDGTLIAWQSQTGTELWRRRLALVGPPTACGDEILVRRLLAKTTGELGETTAIVAGQDGTLRQESLGDPRLMPGLRINPESSSSEGEGAPAIPLLPAQEGAAAVPALGPVLVSGRTTVVLSGDAIEARALADGQVRWRSTLPRGRAAASDAPTDPVIAGDLVVIGCLDGWIRAFDLATGSVRWSVDAGSPLGAGRIQMLRCQPAVAAGRIYLTTRAGDLVCIDTGDRSLSGPRWWGDRG